MARKKAAPAGPSAEEAAFLRAIAAAPDDDTPRLAFADWLDEHGRAERAELIRVQIELEPVRGRYEDARVVTLHQREDALLQTAVVPDRAWFAKLLGKDWYTEFVVYRRGFPSAVKLPAQWLVRHGDAIREHFPTVNQLILFRLNGWGERVAGCAALGGFRVLELPCWYADADADALAASPHLSRLERLGCWWPGSGQAERFARGLPSLRDLKLIGSVRPADVEGVNRAAGRPIATPDDPSDWLFPFAADFSSSFFVGRLPDGTQVFGEDPAEAGGTTAEGSTTLLLYDAAGTPSGRWEVRFPVDILGHPDGPNTPVKSRDLRSPEWRARRVKYLADMLGFEPAFIRVQEMGFRGGSGHWYGASRLWAVVREHTGAPDAVELAPEDDENILGNGGLVHRWITSGSFCFDYGSDWWCDGSGHVTST